MVGGVDYTQLSAHRAMLADGVRVAAHRKALAGAVRAGDVVLDVGAGTAIMAMLAAQAGARKVYAVERTSTAALARRLVRENGLADRVEVIQADAERVSLPEKVDAVVGELWGCIAVDENLLPTLLICRDRWLKPGGKLLPLRMTTWLAPVYDPRIPGQHRFWRRRLYGLDLSAIAELGTNEMAWGSHPIHPASLLGRARRLWTVDVAAMSVEEAERPLTARRLYMATQPGEVSALAGWFTMEFPDGTTLSNAPDQPPTHWGQAVFPLRRGLPVKTGTPIEVDLTYEPAERGSCHMRWQVRVGNGDWEVHDSRSSAEPDRV